MVTGYEMIAGLKSDPMADLQPTRFARELYSSHSASTKSEK